MSRAFLPLTILPVIALLFSACAPTPAATSAPTALPTAEPTPTENPQPSPTLPSPPADLFRPAENGLDMAASPFSAPPVIDGDLSDWAEFPCYILDQASQIGYGDAAAWEGPSDLSGSFCWGWDEEALYLAAEVHDNLLRVFSKGNFWENDYIELWVDANLPGDFDEAQNNGDDFQFGFLPGNFSDIPARATVFVPGVSTSKLRQIQVAFVPAEGGYRGEIKIPWATFGDWLDRSNGRLGASLCFSDDDSDQPAQEMMICSAPGAMMQWGNPMLWNNLSLIGAPLSPTPTATPAPAAVSTDAPSIPAPFYTSSFQNNFSAGEHLFLYLDADASAATAYAVGGIGADYMLQDGWLFQSTGGPGWGWNAVACASLTFPSGSNAHWTFACAPPRPAL